jgi:signal peptidase II
MGFLVLRREAIWLGIGVFCLDMLTKWATQEYLPPLEFLAPVYPYGGVALFQDCFGIEASLTHAANTGAAWGLGAGYPGLLAVIRLVVALMLWAGLFFARSAKSAIGLALIAVGAAGNALDYFLYGHVVDMVKLVFWGYHYPIFNVADMAICLGALILAFSGTKSRKPRPSLVWRA